MARVSDIEATVFVPPGDEHLDVRIARLAGQQHSVVGRSQLVALGAGEGAIAHRLKIHRLHRLHRGVYVVGDGSTTRGGRWMAAVLACGPGALLSHRAAAALRELGAAPRGPIDVTIARGSGRGRRGIAIHATRSVTGADRDVVAGIPCTSLPRTLVDLAAVLPPSELNEALGRARNQTTFDRAAIEQTLERLSPGRAGTRKLRRLLDESEDTRSARGELERRFLKLVRSAGLPAPVVNGYVAGMQVDFHWPQQRVIFETDGSAFHSGPGEVERDRQHDLQLGLAGWTVERVTWGQVVRQPASVTALLRQRLGPQP